MPVRTQPLTREGLLERYRAPKATPGDIARAREHSDKGLSRARGAGAETRSGTPAKESGRRDPAVSTELRKQRFERTAKRLEQLNAKDPGRAKEVMHAGEAVAIASQTSLRIAAGVGIGVTGGGTGACFWDPCNTHACAPVNTWMNTCGPCSFWWWNNCTYWWPCSGWSFGVSWNWGWGNCGWYSHPYCYYPGYCYWAGSPYWYTSVIYQDAYAEPQQVVEHAAEEQPAAEAQPAPEYAQAPNPPPEKRDPALAQALVRSAQQYVALGDLAFSERRYGDAVSHYAKAIEYAPDDAVLYMLLSDALFATGDYHYAASALRKALDLEPRLVDTIVDKHAVYGDPQEFEKQLGYLENYLKDNFLDEDARLVLGANYLFGNKPHQALDLLQSSFSLEVRKTRVGTLLFERAQKLAADNPFSK